MYKQKRIYQLIQLVLLLCEFYLLLLNRCIHAFYVTICVCVCVSVNRIYLSDLVSFILLLNVIKLLKIYLKNATICECE